MKIEAMSGYPVFSKKEVSNHTAKPAVKSADHTGKTDVVDFSRGQTSAPDKSLLSIKSAILRDISGSLSARELSELKDRIRAGSYHPSTDAIVDAILGE